MRGKKAGERFISPYLFLILALIAVGIFGMVWVFSSVKIDVRGSEADILADRILDCVSDAGFLNEEVLKKDFDFFKGCNLDEQVIDKSGNYYFKISIFEGGALLDGFPVRKGVGDFEMRCEIKEDSESENFAVCSKRRLSVFREDGGEVEIKILAGSNQLGGKL